MKLKYLINYKSRQKIFKNISEIYFRKSERNNNKKNKQTILKIYAEAGVTNVFKKKRYRKWLKTPKEPQLNRHNKEKYVR